MFANLNCEEKTRNNYDNNAKVSPGSFQSYVKTIEKHFHINHKETVLKTHYLSIKTHYLSIQTEVQQYCLDSILQKNPCVKFDIIRNCKTFSGPNL